MSLVTWILGVTSLRIGGLWVNRRRCDARGLARDWLRSSVDSRDSLRRSLGELHEPV